MLFTDAEFLYAFLPAFLGLYYLAQERFRPWIIAAFSYGFYAWWRPDFVLLMWLSTVLDYTAGRGIDRARRRSNGVPGDGKRGPGRGWVWLSCAANLGLLAYFKYANFGVETFNSLLVHLGDPPVAWTSVVLPVGISFYTFQSLSYTLDVYRGDARPVRRFRDFACYVSMFPQLVAGPIVRYQSLSEQLVERTHSPRLFGMGVLFFQAGLAKKVLLADTLAPVVQSAFESEALTTLGAWIGALSYTFQLYFDFSGYSDMAIGLGLMIGFRFPINFDRPYTSLSITEFWRRWHISLSTFLRDYLYIPLGGNQKGRARTYVNLSLTMLLGGLWHGAAWTFIVWGAYQGFWLVLERLAGRRTLYYRLPRAVQLLATFVIVVMGWVFFRADTMVQAGDVLASMVGWTGSGASDVTVPGTAAMALAVAAAVTWGLPSTQALASRRSIAWMLGLQVLFIATLIALHSADHVPFLYFQF